MYIYIDPKIHKNLKQEFTAKFELESVTIPPYMFAPGAWINGTNGLQYILIDPPILPGDIERTGYYYIPGTSGTAGTHSYAYRSNLANEVVQYESLVFGNREPFQNICEWDSILEDISGDTDFLYFQKEMRWSTDRQQWTTWAPISSVNLPQSQYCDEYDYWFEFKYIALPYFNYDRDRTYTSLDPIDDSNYDILTTNLTPIQIDIDYPTQGTVQIYLNGILVTNPLAFKFGLVVTTADSIPNVGDFIFISQYQLGYEIGLTDTIEIRYVDRVLPDSYIKSLEINNLFLTAKFVIERAQSIVNLTYPGQFVILETPDIYKAFKFTGFQIDVAGIVIDTTGTSGIAERTLDLKYRISSNYKHSWTPWEFLTLDNIRTLKPDPVRFLNIEVGFIRTGTDTTGAIKVYDLMLEGDFQNITKSYKTLNKFGFRGQCDYTLNPSVDECYSVTDIPDIWRNSRTKNCDGDSVMESPSVDSCSSFSTPTWNVYDLQPLNLYNKLANDNTSLFGHEVKYYKTKPDAKGMDAVLHEQQLLYISDRCTIKVIVPDNKFPESTIHFNMFDLALFEVFKIQITRDEFKIAFGIEQRPAVGDIINFCILNRWYMISHAQAFKDVLNGSVYYNVVLKKHQKLSKIDKREFASEVDSPLEHNSLDNLFGDDVQREMNKGAEAPQMETLTDIALSPLIQNGEVVIVGGGDNMIRKAFDPTLVVDYDLYNSSVIVSRYYYDLSKAPLNQAAITYGFSDQLAVSTNRTFVLWFNIQEYITQQRYVLLNNRHPTQPLGYDIAFEDGMIEFRLNELSWLWDVSVQLNTWYIVVIRLNQRERHIEFWLYRRQNEANPLSYSTTDLVKVANQAAEFDEPQAFSVDRLNMKLMGSPILLTNLRIWDSLLPESQHMDVLNQYFVKDGRDLIIADSALKQLYAINRGA